MNPQEAKKLEQKVNEILTKFLSDTKTVIAGISGGPDSIFLLIFLAKLPLKTIVAHIDHKLRKESGDDKIFVKNFTKQINSQKTIFRSKTVDIAKISKRLKKGIEETGRDERYKFFNKLAKHYNAPYIITAHHADDNLETIILNLTRGATLKGLTGMSILDNNLFRPLLPFTKKQITDYLKYKKIPFIIEKSNFSDKYNRNLIRLKVIPELKKINPNIALTVSKNTENLREIQNYLESQTKKWLKKFPKNKIPTKPFRTLNPALQKMILRELYKQHCGDTKDLEKTHMEEVVELISKNNGNKRKKAGKLLITLKNNSITIKKA